MKTFDQMSQTITIYTTVLLIVFIIVLFIIFLKKNEVTIIKNFFENFKKDIIEIYKEPEILIVVILFIFFMMVVSLALIEGKPLYLKIVLAILVITIIAGIILYFEIFLQIIEKIGCDFTINKRLRKRAIIATFYPIMNILIVRISFIYIDFESLSNYMKIVMLIVKLVVIISSFVLIPISLLITYEGIKDCMMNSQHIYKHDMNRNIKRVKIYVAIVWFFTILINSANIVYFSSNLLPGMFIYTTEKIQPHVMRISSAFYFSLITLLTIGYGDIVPGRLAGRIVTSFISIMGAAYSLIALGSILSDNNTSVIKILKYMSNKKSMDKLRK